VKPYFARTGFQPSLLFLQLLLCTKNKFLATSTLMSLLTCLMKAGLSWMYSGRESPSLYYVC